MEANHSRSWLARMVAAEARPANRSSWHSFTLFSMSPPARPAVQGGPAEVLVAAGRLAGPGRVVLGPGEVDGNPLDQARVARQAEDEVDPARLAPGHERLAGEAAVGAQQDANPRPAGPDPADDALDLFEGARR